MIIRTWTVAAGMLLAGPALAQDAECKDAITTVQMQDCMARQGGDAEAKLNATYKRVMAALDKNGQPATKKALLEAQRLWVTFRDKDCAALASLYEGGTFAATTVQSCRNDAAKQRATALEAYLPR